MSKIAIVNTVAGTVLKAWALDAGQTELPIRYTLPDGSQISPVSLGWADEVYTVLPVTEFELPDGKRRVGPAVYQVENGDVIETYDVEDIPPPDRVTARQFKLQLLEDDLIDAVEAWVSQQDRSVRIAYETSGTFYRHEPMMQAGFAALEFTEQRIDDFFRAAGEL